MKQISIYKAKNYGCAVQFQLCWKKTCFRFWPTKTKKNKTNRRYNLFGLKVDFRSVHVQLTSKNHNMHKINKYPLFALCLTLNHELKNKTTAPIIKIPARSIMFYDAYIIIRQTYFTPGRRQLKLLA